MALAAYTAHNFPTSDMEPGLKEGAFYDPTNFTFPAGCHICEVEVDPETGVTEIVHFIAVDDFGNDHQPDDRRGPGAWRHRAGHRPGAARRRASTTTCGQLLTGSYMDYTMPRADDLPSLQAGLTETACPSNPLGIKGCGEAGAIGAPPAVINAITDALGDKDLTMPATPQTVWRAIGAPARSGRIIRDRRQNTCKTSNYHRPADAGGCGQAAQAKARTASSCPAA